MSQVQSGRSGQFLEFAACVFSGAARPHRDPPRGKDPRPGRPGTLRAGLLHPMLPLAAIKHVCAFPSARWPCHQSRTMPPRMASTSCMTRGGNSAATVFSNAAFDKSFTISFGIEGPHSFLIGRREELVRSKTWPAQRRHNERVRKHPPLIPRRCAHALARLPGAECLQRHVARRSI